LKVVSRVIFNAVLIEWTQVDLATLSITIHRYVNFQEYALEFPKF
jgi:hypothetical protein